VKSPVVRLKIRVRLPDGSRPYLDPVFSANNKLEPGYAQLNGAAVHFPAGVYHLRYAKGGTRVWEAIGSDPQLALTWKRRREKALDAKAAGVTVMEDESEVVPQTSLSKASADYLDEIAAHKSKKTFAAYSLTLKLFQQCCSKRHLEDIERKDILSFISFLKDMKNGPRTGSARTIQRWLRHSSLDTTLRYLAASDDRSERTREQVNNTFAAFTAVSAPDEWSRRWYF